MLAFCLKLPSTEEKLSDGHLIAMVFMERQNLADDKLCVEPAKMNYVTTSYSAHPFRGRMMEIFRFPGGYVPG